MHAVPTLYGFITTSIAPGTFISTTGEVTYDTTAAMPIAFQPQELAFSINATGQGLPFFGEHNLPAENNKLGIRIPLGDPRSPLSLIPNP